MSNDHDYHIAAEPDVSGSANRHIWYYFIAFGIGLFATFYGLTVMYSFEVDREKDIKIGAVQRREATDEVSRSQSYLSGKRGLFEGKQYVAIDVAMAKYLQDLRRRAK